jgi:MFS family permease
VGFRELCINVMEVPTGAIADLYGRRRAMILSFVAYIIAFAVFAVSGVVWHLFAAMFFFAIGEAFRTGTHKAMILEWLRLQGREQEKTKTYGYTRSWAKIGSAVSVVIASALVYYSGRYSDIFWLCIIPYGLGIINFLGYPAALDGTPQRKGSPLNAARHLADSLREALGERRVRRVLLESMGYESACKVVADYVQPMLKQLAIGLPLLVAASEGRRTAILVGGVYLILHLASSVASRRSHAAAAWMGGEGRAARRLWQTSLLLFACMTVALLYGAVWGAVALFVALESMRNVWRPVAITRIDNETQASKGATMLSIESQAKAAGTMVLAPLAGLAVDRFAVSPQQPALWAAAALGAAIVAVGAAIPEMRPRQAA